ncbi:MAG TPA: RagB/SusD family nutrient uptake outer membrane protein [Hanamia sp.]
MKNLKYSAIILLVFTASCKKLIDIQTPQNQLTTDKVFADTTSATSAIVNAYALFDKIIDPNYNKFMSVYTDDATYPSTSADNVEFNNGKLSATNGVVGNFWSNSYNAIYSCNEIIEQLQQTSAIPTVMVGSLTGEAKFLRAYADFYLVSSYGPVPLIQTTNVDQTSKATRTDTAIVFAQIIADLKDAQNALPVTYIGAGKVRVNRWAATALLARAYLYSRNWTAAETQSSAVINAGSYSLNTPSTTFLANSNETILSFWTQNGFISDAASLIPASGAPLYPITSSLVSAFENGDLRKTNWLKSIAVTASGITTAYYYSYKYHNRTTNTSSPEYLVALRLAEQYLIRAEARAQQNNVSGAIQDLNIIRRRAGLNDLSSSLSQSACLNAIMQEWRVEFFMEWGHRFLELKRIGRLNQVMSAFKTAWLPQAAQLPIPQKDITYDPLLTQNTGY